jgi:plasmid replication initiation protein
MTRDAHDDALQRLSAELVEQDRLTERYAAAVGTSSELAAYARLQHAGEQVAAREAWLHWVDDEDYRGLNAGPFELFAEAPS